MNRAERRKMMKTIPGYKKGVKNASKNAVDDLEMMFEKHWKKYYETTLNDERWDYKSSEEDNIYTG